MPNEIYGKRNVDIYQHPDTITVHEENSQLTIGDLHGNAIKFIYFLIKEGILQLKEKDDYCRLVAIYNKLPATHDQITSLYRDYVRDDGSIAISVENQKAYELDKQDDVLTRYDLEEFVSILKDSIVTKNKPKLIRLIGDETGDRGSNDIFTLFILTKLTVSSIPYEILASNHGQEFINHYEGYAPKNHILDHQRASLLALNLIVKNGLLQKETIDERINTVYKPNLSLLSYSIADNDITIFSHAAVGLNTINALANQLGVCYDDSTVTHLAVTIDKINQAYKKLVLNHNVHTLLEQNADKDNNAFYQVLWNRKYEQLDRPEVARAGYSLSFIHGHDMNDPGATNVINIDNSLGKQGRAGKHSYYGMSDYEIVTSSGNIKIENKIIEKSYTDINMFAPSPTNQAVVIAENTNINDINSYKNAFVG